MSQRKEDRRAVAIGNLKRRLAMPAKLSIQGAKRFRVGNADPANEKDVENYRAFLQERLEHAQELQDR